MTQEKKRFRFTIYCDDLIQLGRLKAHFKVKERRVDFKEARETLFNEQVDPEATEEDKRAQNEKTSNFKSFGGGV